MDSDKIAIDCEPMAVEDVGIVTLVANDGQAFRVPVEVANQSPALKAVLDIQKNLPSDQDSRIDFKDISADLLESLLSIMTLRAHDKKDITDLEFFKSLAEEQQRELFEKGMGFLELPLLARYVAHNLHEQYSGNKQEIEQAIKENYPESEGVAIAKQYFFLFGDVTKVWPSRETEFLEISPYGFNLKELIAYGKVPAIDKSSRLLDLSCLKLYDLHGLQEITKDKNLRELNLGYNQPSSLRRGAFERLPNLEALNLNNNQLLSLDKGVFHGLTNLKKLYILSNQLTYLEPGVFEKLSELEVLYLADNQLSSFAGLPELKKLQLTENQLSLLKPGTFLGLGNLKYLSIGFNELTSLESGVFAGLPTLESLYLPNNQLKSFEPQLIAGLPKLKYLNLQNNKLSAENIKQLRAKFPNVNIEA
jgi:Leucine-rich repeat (LRR) protein